MNQEGVMMTPGADRVAGALLRKSTGWVVRHAALVEYEASSYELVVVHDQYQGAGIGSAVLDPHHRELRS